jgi:hypothetical protein
MSYIWINKTVGQSANLFKVIQYSKQKQARNLEKSSCGIQEHYEDCGVGPIDQSVGS